MAKPVIAWQGGKRRLAKYILPLFPEHQCYVEPFAGAAALLFAKEPGAVEVLNDVNGELVNLYRVIQHHLEELLRQFKWALVSRQVFEWERMKEPETLTDIQRAARFFYLQKTAFGAKPVGQVYGYAPSSLPRFNLLRLEEDLSTAHLRLARVNVEQLDWQDCLARYDRPTTLFYCDPPYLDTAGYGVPFGIEQYEQLAERARSMSGACVISLNDHPEVRRIFAGFDLKKVAVKYTVGGQKAGAAASPEVILRNANAVGKGAGASRKPKG